MKKYLAYDGINSEYEEFDTIEEAREYLTEGFLQPGEGYHPDLKDCAIYKLCEAVDYDVIDSKDNYPEIDEDSEEWPFDNEFDEIWKHKFVPISE